MYLNLASKIMLPTTIQVLIEGQSIFMREISNVYTVLNCIIIAIFSFLLGVSAFYLFITYSVMPEKEKVEQEAEQKEAGSESALRVQDADAQVPETRHVSPNWNTEVYAFENIAGLGRPQFDISI
jgi:hypothetical protein